MRRALTGDRPALAADDQLLLPAVLALLIAAMAWLCLSVTILPLGDYPNHLARLFIQTHIATDPYLAEYYRLFWHFQPNLSLEAVAWLLSPFFDIYTVGRLLGVATFASLAIGLAALHRVLHGRFSPAALLPVVIVINRYFVWGSLGYLLALGAAFGAVAVWLACRERPLLQFILGIVLATAVYLGHLYAFGVYAVCTVGYEARLLLPRPAARRRLTHVAAAVAQLVPAGLLLLFLSPTAQAPEVPQWQGLVGKLVGPVVLFPGYDLMLEAALFAVCLGLPLIAWLRGAGRFRFDFSIAIIAFALLYVVLPDKLFSGFGADRRLLVPLAMLVMVSFDWTAISLRARTAQWLLVAITSIVALVNVGIHWQSYERSYADLQRLTSMVEPGGRVYGVMVNASGQYLPYPPLQEMVSLAVIDRSAFVPSLFVYPTNAASSPLVYTARYAPIARRLNILYASNLKSAQFEFDTTRTLMEKDGLEYLLLIDSRKFSLQVPSDYQLLGTTSDGTGRLFRIRK
jgi:hypothetical protein